MDAVVSFYVDMRDSIARVRFGEFEAEGMLLEASYMNREIFVSFR